VVHAELGDAPEQADHLVVGPVQSARPVPGEPLHAEADAVHRYVSQRPFGGVAIVVVGC
jgi:hypothetical protein